MKLALAVLLACGGSYLDPDGKDIYFYEECLHMERKFNDEIHQKCKKYSELKLQESARI